MLSSQLRLPNPPVSRTIPPSLLQWPSRCIQLCHHSHSRVPACAASRGSNSSWQPQEPFDETTKRALREAAQLLAEAQELARQQTRADLLAAWNADTTTPPQSQQQQQRQPPPAAAVAGPQDPPSSSSSGGDQAAAAAAAASGAASSEAALAAFWVEQGLSGPEAQALMREVGRDPQLAAAACNTQLLGQKLWALRRVLPGLDVVRLVARTPQLLLVPSSSAVQILVDMVQALPGCDVMDMVARQPRLLLQEAQGLPERLAAVLDKLRALHPSHMERVVAGIVEENPELLLRMPYYLGPGVMLLDDLPIEIQNMMVLGDHGVGYLYRYWGNRLTEPRSGQARWETGGGSSSAA